MKLKEALKFMSILFCVITTLESIFIASVSLLFDPSFIIDAWDILRILFVALTGVLPVLILIRSEKAPRAELMIRKILHFILTAGIVFTLLIYFGWMGMANALIITLFFLAIYISATIVQEIQARKLADQLNARLDAFHKAENETHQ
jgi:magnesium-transporting ATPase (P-type)